MYFAVADQEGRESHDRMQELRELTGSYMMEHTDDFLPFLSHPTTGDMLTPPQYQKYCNDIIKTPAWGGQVEVS